MLQLEAPCVDLYIASSSEAQHLQAAKPPFAFHNLEYFLKIYEHIGAFIVMWAP